MKHLSEFFDIFSYPSEAVCFFTNAEHNLNSIPEVSSLLEKHIALYESSDSFDLAELNADIKKASELSGISEYAILFIIYAEMSFHMREIYDHKGIDRKIWYDSVRDLSFKNRECKNVKGEWGLFTDWFQGFLKLRLFALGRLQYQADPFNASDEPLTRHGILIEPGKTTALSIHIPSDGRLLPEDVLASLKTAYDFHKALHIDGKIVFQCSSWLLYPKMLDFMTPGSNLSKFIGCFELLSSDTDPEFRNCWRLFDRDYSEGSKALPRDTTLRRQYAEWLDAGNLPGWGRGIIVFDGEHILK